MTYIFLAVGFLFLSVDDVIQMHEYFEKHSALLIRDLNSDGGLAIYLGPSFAAVLVIGLTAVISSRYMLGLKSKNRYLLVISFACILTMMIAEIIYLQSQCSNIDLCFRIEIVFEESSELIAILSFLTFLHREALEENGGAGSAGDAGGAGGAGGGGSKET